MQPRHRQRRPSRRPPGGERQQRHRGRQVAAEEGVEQPLRLERHDPRAGTQQRPRPVADVRADVEGEVARARRCRGRSGRAARCSTAAPGR